MRIRYTKFKVAAYITILLILFIPLLYKLRVETNNDEETQCEIIKSDTSFFSLCPNGFYGLKCSFSNFDKNVESNAVLFISNQRNIHFNAIQRSLYNAHYKIDRISFSIEGNKYLPINNTKQ